MDEETTSAIDTLRAEIAALRVLVLSHIMAADASDPGSAKAAIDVAETELAATRAAGKRREAVKLAALLENLRELLGPLAAND